MTHEVFARGDLSGPQLASLVNAYTVRRIVYIKKYNNKKKAECLLGCLSYVHQPPTVGFLELFIRRQARGP